MFLWKTEFIWNKYVFTVTFDQFNASLLNKILISFKKTYWPQTFKWKYDILSKMSLFVIDRTEKRK